MHNLRFLKFCSNHRPIVHLPQGLAYLPSQLVLLHWECFPLESLPATFCPRNLVELDMSNSKVKRLWDGVVPLVNLKRINLEESEYLQEIPDFSMANSLEDVSLRGCKSLLRVHPSILSCHKLLSLDLSCCESLTSLLSDVHLRSLCELYLTGCSRLKEFSVISKSDIHLSLKGTAITWIYLIQRSRSFEGCSSMKEFALIQENTKFLNLSYTAIKELPSSLGCLGNLWSLNLNHCAALIELPSSLGCLSELNVLSLNHCVALKELPSSLACLSNLWSLNLNHCAALKELPSSLGCLSKLFELNLKHCAALKELPSSLGCLSNLWRLNLDHCVALKELPSSLGCLSNLRSLNLNHCAALKELPSSLGCLSHLTYLFLDSCKSLTHLPSNLADPFILYYLSINGWDQLGYLPWLPLSLKELRASNCKSLKTIEKAIDPLSRKMPSLYLANCFNLDGQLVEQINNAFKERIYEESNVMWPGSQVPDWFVDKTLGASITIDLHSKPRGFSICLILSSASLSSKFDYDGVQFSLETDDSHLLKLWDRYNIIEGVRRLDSDHMCLFSCLRVRITSGDFPQKVSFRFKAHATVYEEDEYDNIDFKDLEEIGIKACGVDILYEECEVGCSCDNTNENKRVTGDELQLFPPTNRFKPFDLNHVEADLLCASALEHSFMQEGDREKLEIKGYDNKRAWGDELHLFPPSKRLKPFDLNNLEAE